MFLEQKFAILNISIMSQKSFLKNTENVPGHGKGNYWYVLNSIGKKINLQLGNIMILWQKFSNDFQP